MTVTTEYVVPPVCPHCGSRELEMEIVAWGVWCDGVFDKRINDEAGFSDTVPRPVIACPSCNKEWMAERRGPRLEKRHG